MNDVETLGRLRRLVAFLGQSDQFGWWTTSFLGPTGLQMLEFNFPRDPIQAGITATVEAARRLHDDRIGRRGVYHLFRLPPELERAVFEARAYAKEDDLRRQVEDPAVAREALGQLASATVSVPEGPVQVGFDDEILDQEHLQELAKHYLSAFEQNIQCFPYLKMRS